MKVRLQKYLSMQLLYANQAALKLEVWVFVSWSRSLLFACLNCCQCMFCAELSSLHGLGVAESQFVSGVSPRSLCPALELGCWLWIPPAPVALCWQELGLGPTPAPAWVLSKPWEWLGVDGDMQCCFMMDQNNSETISSISRQCPCFYKASVLCP